MAFYFLTILLLTTCELVAGSNFTNFNLLESEEENNRDQEYGLEIHDERIRGPRWNLRREKIWNTVRKFARKLGVSKNLKQLKQDLNRTYRILKDKTKPLVVIMQNKKIRDRWITAYQEKNCSYENWYLVKTEDDTTFFRKVKTTTENYEDDYEPDYVDSVEIAKNKELYDDYWLTGNRYQHG
ncbi:hypothetical protein WDU94_010557 [Cyamophila willieti]